MMRVLMVVQTAMSLGMGEQVFFLSSTPLTWEVITHWDTGCVFLNFAVLGVPRL